MTIDVTTARIPTQIHATAADPTIAYLDFLYGFGAGTDLGPLGAYTRVVTAIGDVWRQDFEDGIALANFGDRSATVVLEHPYYDMAGTLHMSVGVRPHTVEVLRREDV